jgi:hypothetical protein
MGSTSKPWIMRFSLAIAVMVTIAAAWAGAYFFWKRYERGLPTKEVVLGEKTLQRMRDSARVEAGKLLTMIPFGAPRWDGETYAEVANHTFGFLQRNGRLFPEQWQRATGVFIDIRQYYALYPTKFTQRMVRELQEIAGAPLHACPPPLVPPRPQVEPSGATTLLDESTGVEITYDPRYFRPVWGSDWETAPHGRAFRFAPDETENRRALDGVLFSPSSADLDAYPELRIDLRAGEVHPDTFVVFVAHWLHNGASSEDPEDRLKTSWVWPLSVSRIQERGSLPRLEIFAVEVRQRSDGMGLVDSAVTGPSFAVDLSRPGDRCYLVFPCWHHKWDMEYGDVIRKMTYSATRTKR